MAEIFIESLSKEVDRTGVLREYYSRYLTSVRKSSPSTVKHYFDALNNISRRLKEKNLVKESIYEIADIDYLFQVREVLFQDQDFLAANKRGNQMYSAGLNNYCRFASGEDFTKISNEITELDLPIKKEQALMVTQTVWRRSGILKIQAFAYANFKCELGNNHETFIAESTHKPYLEGHHAIPMSMQDNFSVSLDVYANIICLCPLCHRKIHYGLTSEKSYMLDQIYDQRSVRMEKSGIQLSRREFKSLF